VTVLQDCLALGAIFATTDSVAVLQVLEQDRAPLLFNLVFGEGVIMTPPLWLCSAPSRYTSEATCCQKLGLEKERRHAVTTMSLLRTTQVLTEGAGYIVFNLQRGSRFNCRQHEIVYLNTAQAISCTIAWY